MHDDYGSSVVMAPIVMASITTSFDADSSFLYSDRTALGYEKQKGQFYGSSGDSQGRVRMVETEAAGDNMAPEGGGHARKLSDVQLASRRAEEAASRRAQAAAWLQRMVGALDLSAEPSEEELRLCLRNGMVLCSVLNKVHPGAAVKVVENPTPSTPEEGAHSAYQYFENVRNYVVAVEEMGLPTFEASDLEEVSYLPGSSAKVVDSVLALKAYHDWRLSGGTGFWKYSGPVKSPRMSGGRGFSGLTSNGVVKSPSLLSQTNIARPNNSHRKRWPVLDSDGHEDGELSSPDSADLNNYKAGRALALPQGNGYRRQNGSADAALETEALNGPMSESTATWIQHIGFRIREVLQGKAKRIEGFPGSDDKENSGAMNIFDDAPSQSLLSLVSAIIGDKHPEEVPMLVEFILRKVMEEFERRLQTQGEQIKKMTSALKEILTREEKLTSRAKVLEALAAGTGEEVKLVSNHLQQVKMEKKHIEEEKRAKEEDIERLMREREEKQMHVDVLRNELEVIKRADQEQQLQLQLQKRELEMESRVRIRNVESQLLESQRKAKAVEASYANEIRGLRKKHRDFEGAMWLQCETIQELKAASERTRLEVVNMQHAWSSEIESLGTEMLKMAQAASGYHKVLEENRQLYNEVQDLKGNIRVYCRVRPFLPSQSARQSTVDFVGENGDLVIVHPSKQGKDARKVFSFNKVFDTSAAQEQVFLDTQPLIRSVLDGFNVCIFAYGQTGSGKTHTMSGPTGGSEEDWGVNYRALNDLFSISQSRTNVIQYEVGVQMIEIYNEQVRDLLVSDGSSKRLEIRNSSQQNGLNVPDASMMTVGSTGDVLDLMKIGQKNRAVGATALNERSSRSHSVLTVHVQGTDLKSGAILRGCLHLVDLAGSERVDKSEATGERLKEAQHINKSLSALGDVIAALAQKNAHVPYRNSKLTQLLQDSLGGQAKTLMFVHISPDFDSYGETISTLKFAERVATVELGAARSHKESGDLRDLRDQISSLKDLLVKKDGEIERLTKEIKAQEAERLMKEAKPHAAESGSASLQQPVLKPKIASSPFTSRRVSTSGEIPRIKKPSSESMLVSEGHQSVRASHERLPKQRPSLVLAVSQDGSSEDHEAESPLDSPPGQRLSSEDGHSKPYHAQRQGTSNRSTSPDSDPPPPTLVETNHYRTRPSRNLVVKQESNSKDWQDRIDSSTNMSLLASACHDENSISWSGGELPKLDGDVAGLPSAPFGSSQLQAQSSGSGVQEEAETSGRDQRLVAPDDRGPELPGSQETEVNRDPYASVDALLNEPFRNEVLDRRDAEGDYRSDLSEGELSQGTDSSSVNLTDQVVPARREESNIKKLQQGGERRPHVQSQIPRPPTKDRKQSVSDQPHVRARRYSMAGTDPKRLSSGLNRPGTDVADDTKPAPPRHPPTSTQQKSSKRWL